MGVKLIKGDEEVNAGHGDMTFSVGVKPWSRSVQLTGGHGDMTFSVGVKRQGRSGSAPTGHGDMTFSVGVKPILALALVKSAVLRLLSEEKAQNGRLGRRFLTGFSGKLGAARTASYAVCAARRLILVSRCRADAAALCHPLIVPSPGP